jgi:5-oxoprolinase (ATP-hydrolysing)
VYEIQEPCSTFYTLQNRASLITRLDKMTTDVKEELKKQGFEDKRVHFERMLNMRFEGTDTVLMVLPTEKDGDGQEDFEAAFNRVYKSEFGFLLDTKSIIVDDIKVCCSLYILLTVNLTVFQVRGIGKTFDTLGESVHVEVAKLTTRPVNVETRADARYSVYFDRIGRVNGTPVFLLDKLEVGDVLTGPAMIIDDTQTIVLVPGAQAVLTSKHLYITLE